MTTPSADPVAVNGIVDTGAQACIWGAADFYKSGYEEQNLVRVKQKVAAINRQPIDILGAVFLTVEVNSLTTNAMVFVTPDIQGLYLSRQVLTELYVIPEAFPRAGDTKPKARDGGPDPMADRAPCGCLQRRNPFPKPKRMPPLHMANNTPSMQRWLRKTSATPTLWSRPHQTPPVTKANPTTPHTARAQEAKHPPRQAKLVPAYTCKMVIDAGGCSDSTLIREEDRHFTTFVIQRGPHGLKVALWEHDEYPELLDKTMMSVERTEKIRSETLPQSGHQDLKTHRWREFDQLAIMGKQGASLSGNRFQSCEKSGEFD